MTRQSSRRSVLAGAGGGVLCGVAGCLSRSRDVEQTVTKTHTTDELRAVTVSTTLSDVDVHTASTDAIDIEGQKAAVSRDDLESIGLATVIDDDILDISVDRDDARTVFGLRPDPVLDLSVTVPDRLEVRRIDSKAGDLEVENAVGNLQITSETGDVSATAVEGIVSAATETGDLVRYHLCTALTAVGCEHPGKLVDGRDALVTRLSDADDNPYIRGQAAGALGLLESVDGEGITAPSEIEAETDEAAEFVRSRLAVLRAAETESSVDRTGSVGTLDSLRSGTEEVVDAMMTPDGDECPHCGLSIPEDGPPMCPRCGAPR
ncbi:hypothetical protein [Natronorubrum sp. DTA7]|uniref:hypothetical protein n=1 Tax=Natronorubrum sp. DTA7 TaxID=3447016 RepID=UPI003F83A7EA